MRSQELLDFYYDLAGETFVVIDLETTGGNFDFDRAIEVAVVRASLREGITLQRCDLIDPGMAIPPRIQQFTGIRPAMLAQAPTPQTVWPDYVPVLQAGILTGHNVSFDYTFARRELARLGIAFARLPQEQLCTVQLARLLLADLPSRSLPNLVRHFNFPIARSHRAADDALACWLLLKTLLAMLWREPPENLLAKFAQQWIGLEEAAVIVGCPPTTVVEQLAQAGLEPQWVKRSGRLRYRRGAVEAIAPPFG
ncbi:MAG TPA: 3'-5' exonuclease [Cyanobacteria bacterium UBA8156]|jgi:DNA polymerase-3 subunit epsilon|nr:3'-5' exonuclease [Cyanobacteria bacterium UBA8156]